jgi:hypothetical protein
MKLLSGYIATFCIYFCCSTFYAQTLPSPGIASRSIHWPKDGPMGPQVFGTGVQDPLQTDQEKSGEDWWYDVRPIYEGGNQTGYMACGFTAHKNYYFDESGLNPKGFMVAPSEFSNDPCERRTLPGEYISPYEQHIGRYDLNGNPIWCKHVNLGGPLLTLINTPDGGFVAVGETSAAYNHHNEPFHYNPTSISNLPVTNFLTPIGSAGSFPYGSRRRLNVVKFDSNGDIEWNYIYGFADLIDGDFLNNSQNFYNQSIYGLDMDITEDGNGYVVMGMIEHLNNSGFKLFMMRINLEGLLESKVTHGPSDNSYIPWARAMDCEGGNCFVTGALVSESFGELSNGTRPGFILKVNDTDLSLSSSWGSTWGSTNPKRYLPTSGSAAILQDIVANPEPDGTIVCCAIKENTGCYYSGVNYGLGAIIKFNNLGQVTDETTFGEVRAYDMKVGMTKLQDGGYAVLTSKRTKDSNGNDIIPDLISQPYDAIMADFFDQATDFCTDEEMDLDVWNTDTYIAKFNESLGKIWDIQFDSDSKPPVNHPGDFKKQECMYRIAEGEDGSLVAVGNSSHNVDDYLFVKVFSDCQSNLVYDKVPDNNGNIVITNSQIWSSSYKIKGRVIIPSGKTLTISNCTIEFADSRRINVDTRVIVEPGGRLIINNATLTSIQGCEKAMWDGIEVHGNPTLRQVPNSNQGYLSISNSTISNARNAATTTAKNFDLTVNWSKTGGGIVIASNSQFINNFASIGMMKYLPLNAQGNPTNDLSGFSKCTFTTTDDFGDEGMTTKPYAQLIMWDTRNIRVLGNKFENLRMNVPEIERGIGILTLDAAYKVVPACNASLLSPAGCPEVNQVKNEFNNLYAGITTSGVNSASFTVDKAIFNNNLYGIRIEGAQFGEIIRSEFNVPFSVVPGEAKYAFGIYSDAASVTKIEDNDFNGIYDEDGRSMGVFMNNSDVSGGGVTNFLNNYSGLNIGTQTAGSNTNLNIDCNTFSKYSNYGLVDIHVANGILGVQGQCNVLPFLDPELPQANVFNGVCDNANFNQLRNSSLSSIEYNSYSQSEVGFSTACNNGNIIGQNCPPLLTFNSGNACPSTITTIGSPVYKNRIDHNKNVITDLKNKIDGGNSSYVLNLIENSNNPALLKSQLAGIAPYLSEQSQMAILNKNIPNAIKKQILEGNAPFRLNVRNGIINSNMPNAVKNQLMVIAYGESPLDRLDKLIKHYENELRVASNDLLKVYLDSNYIDSVSFALTDRFNIEQNKLMIPILIQKDQNATQNFLSEILIYVSTIQVSRPEEAMELQKFHDFYSMLLPIANRSGGYFNLTPSELQEIKYVANEQNSMSSYATSILNFINFHHPYVDAYDLDGIKSLTRQNQTERWVPLPEESVSMIVYPNPSTGIFDLLLSESTSGINLIQVYNLEGRLLFESNSATNSATLDLSDLDQGIYLLRVQTVINETEVVLTERIMVSK